MPARSGAMPSAAPTLSRIQCAMTWRLAKAKFAAAAIAARYCRPSGEAIGAQASCRSGSAMPYLRLASAITRR
jgi:hypothetical protein